MHKSVRERLTYKRDPLSAKRDPLKIFTRTLKRILRYISKESENIKVAREPEKPS